MLNQIMLCLPFIILTVTGWSVLVNVNTVGITNLVPIFLIYPLGIVVSSLLIKDTFSWEIWSLIPLLLVGFSSVIFFLMIIIIVMKKKKVVQ
jgi:hypothetical protein